MPEHKFLPSASDLRTAHKVRQRQVGGVKRKRINCSRFSSPARQDGRIRDTVALFAGERRFNVIEAAPRLVPRNLAEMAEYLL